MKGSVGAIIRWDVEGQAGMRLERLHDPRSDGEVGDEVPVHDVDMDEIGNPRR